MTHPDVQRSRMRSNGRRWYLQPAFLAGSIVCLVWLVHTTAIDRLGITKLVVGLLAAVAASLVVSLGTQEVRRRAGPASKGENSSFHQGIFARRRRIPVMALVGVSLLFASFFLPHLVAARVEGWAPWLVAGLLFALVRRSAHPLVGGVMSLGALLVAMIALGQALGASWFTDQLAAFGDRPVLGTLGNPDLFGVCLAGVLPFTWVRARGWFFSLVSMLLLSAIVLSGSRTAWIMALPTLWPAFRVIRPVRTIAIALVGVCLALVINSMSSHVDLASRIADVSDPRGTAAGRLYLWRVNLELLLEAGPVGGGPEAFQRRWPEIQAEYLANHPDEAHFYSDLRHAHVDAVEVAADWGWIGLALGLFGIALLFRSRPVEAAGAAPAGAESPPSTGREPAAPAGAEFSPSTGRESPEPIGPRAASTACAESTRSTGRGEDWRLSVKGPPSKDPVPVSPRIFEAGIVDSAVAPISPDSERLAARTSLLALLLGGLFTPVLFQVPSLLLAALSAGVLAPRVVIPSRSVWRILAAVGLVFTLFWVGQRTVSEVVRTSGLNAEVSGQLDTARRRYLQAAEIDPTNPLAQVMVARGLLEIDPQEAVEATGRAIRELPTAAVYTLRAVAASAAGEEQIARQARQTAAYLRTGEPGSD